MLQHLALIAAAAVGLEACPTPSGDVTDPQTWGDYFLDKYEHERQVPDQLEPSPGRLARPRTVLLITGVTIPAEWFDATVARLERDNFRPVVYEPPALLSGDLFENSRALARVIDELRARTGEERIDILAECTGGLIARHYLQSLGGAAHVSRLVTFISPQHGLPKAPWAYGIAGWPALRDLSPGSDFLEAVNRAPLPADVPVTSIYTCGDEYIQPYETSLIPGATNIGVCDRPVGHFQFFWDPEIYRIMHRALTAPAPHDHDAPPPAAEPDDAAEVTGDGGCSTGGAGGGAGASLLLALGLVVRRRRR